MDDVIKEFLIECNENLDTLDQDLVVLESSPNSRKTLEAIFRTIHSIKGASGFLALPKLEAVAHAGENLLSDLRDAKLSLTPEITTGLLATVDAIRRILANVEADGQEGEVDNTKLVATLARLRETPSSSLAKTPAEDASPAVADAPADADVTVLQLRQSPPALGAKAPLQTSSSVTVSTTVQANPPAAESKALVEAAAVPLQASGITDTTVRVDVSLLDKLMNLAGELVLARNQILQAPCEDSAFIAASQRLNLITTDLQAGVMKARMQPIDNIWGKFPRIVRDLAQACGKHVRLEMTGKETELDRTIIESIKDPLTHILRNSVDHGIEAPSVRAGSGKPAEGLLALRAFHESGQVNIEIADDGAGINVELVREKAIQRGLITAEAAAHMSDHQITALVFAPGFSTAEKVSNLSGRGVGMDVVKTNIEKIGGSVEIESTAGIGTTLKIKIPLTLAIIPALIVRCGGDRYAIPQLSLIELVRLEDAKEVEYIHGAPVHRLRGELLPLVYLGKELEVKCNETGIVDVVVLQAGPKRFGLVVDEVCDTEEIVVKPLGKQLKGTPCFVGATIMGDGTVSLILDVFSLAQRGGLLSATQAPNGREEKEIARAITDEQQTLLLFQTSDSQRMAIPLSTVARLEEFESSSIERAGTREVVQYRGNILPLVRVASFFQNTGEEAEPSNGTMQAVVYNHNGRSIGLLVGHIQDIVKEHIEVQRTTSHPCILGSAVIQSRVTDLLDLQAIIQAAGLDNRN